MGVCAWARVSAAPRHSWLGCWGLCVLVWPLRLYPATPGWAVWCGCVCLGSGFGCDPPLLAGALGPVCVCVLAPLVPRHSSLACAVWVCVLGLGFRLRPATPGWGDGLCVCVLVCALRLYPANPGLGVRLGCLCLGSGFGCAPPLLAGVLGCVSAWCALRLCPATPGRGVRCGRVRLGSGCGCSPPFLAWVLQCVCLCARSACTPALLAGACGVGVCAWAWGSAAPRHSWLGCWGVCVLACALRLYPTTPGWGVRLGCLCLGSGFGRALPLLAGVLGCVCAWCTLRLCPATPGWGVRCARVCLGSACCCSLPFLAWALGCVCLCAPSACTPPLLAGVCGVGACAWARVSAAPRHSWRVCPGLCVLVWALHLCPATPGWDVRCGCACLGSGFGCAPPLLAGVLGCVCVFVCALRLYSATPGWGVRCGCACLGFCFGCAPPLLAGVLGPVCVCVRAPLVSRQSWLGCVVWVCVPGLGFRLRLATPGWGVGVCVCFCARSACTLPLLAGVCGVWVWYCVVPVSVPVPRCVACCARRPGLRHPVAVVAWHLSVCLGCGRRRASLACLVVPFWCAAPRLVRVALDAPVGFLDAVVPFPSPGGCAPGFTGCLRGARGGRPRTGVIMPAARPRRGRGAGLAPRRTRSGPRDGVVPGGSLRRLSWAACAAVVGVCGPGH